MAKTIRSRLVLFGTTGLATTLLAIACGLGSIAAIRHAHERSTAMASMLGETMTADMMHDAIRGDVLNALLRSGSPEIPAVRKDLEVHLEKFRTSIQALGAVKDTDIRSQLARVKPAIDRYAASGTTLVEAASGSRASAESSFPRFQEEFEFLETEMERLADLVDAAVHAEHIRAASVVRKAIAIDLSLGLAAAALLFFLSRRTARRVSVPLDRSVAVLESFASGDLTRRLGPSDLAELDRMALALNGTIGKQAEILRALAEVAHGTSGSSRRLESVSAVLESGAASANKKVDSTLAAAVELGRLMDAASSSANRSSDEIRGVAAAVEEMSATAHEIARGAEETRQATSASVAAAVEASRRVDELVEASGEISRVIEVIVEIAEQTKLLALNATIEAARAGEAGKGFAVVADEVKSLARSTSEATEDIRRRIETIQNSTAVAVGRIGGIRSAIETSERVIAGIAGAVQEQSATNQEIAHSLARAAGGIREATESVATACDSARRIGKECGELQAESAGFSGAAANVRQEAVALVEQAGILDRQVGGFRFG